MSISESNRKRYGRVVTGCVMLGLLLSACSSSPSSSTPSGASKGGSKAKGTLTISDWRFLETGVGPALSRLYKSYADTHPGVTINTVGYPFSSYPSTIETQIGAHAGPDILAFATGTFATVEHAGDLTPITGLTAAERANLISANSLGRQRGKQYGLISTNTIYGFMYNKKLFAAAGISSAPTSFNGFLKDCITIKSRTGKYGFAARNLVSSSYAWYQDFSGSFLAGYGGAWATRNGKFTVDSPANVEAVSAFQKVYDSGCMLTDEPASIYRPEFDDGNIAMLFDNSNAAATYVDAGKAITNETLGSAPSPLPTKATGLLNVFLSINKYTHNLPLAQNFMSWLFEPAQQRALANVLAPVTIGTNVLPSTAFNDAHPWAPQFYTNVRTARPDAIEGRTYLDAPFATLLMPYIEKVLQKALTPKAALAQAQAAAVAQFGNV